MTAGPDRFGPVLPRKTSAGAADSKSTSRVVSEVVQRTTGHLHVVHPSPYHPHSPSVCGNSPLLQQVERAALQVCSGTVYLCYIVLILYFLLHLKRATLYAACIRFKRSNLAVFATERRGSSLKPLRNTSYIVFKHKYVSHGTHVPSMHCIIEISRVRRACNRRRAFCHTLPHF